MKLNLVLVLILLFISTHLVAQKASKYKKAYYYDLQSKKHLGLIYYRFDHKTFFQFKKEETADDVKIRVTDCKGFVLEKDSFAVVQNIQYEGLGGGLNSKEIDFVQVMEVGNISLYKHFSIQGNPTPYGGLGNPVPSGKPYELISYIIRKKGETEFITIRKRNKRKFKEQIIQVLNDERISNKVMNEVYEWEDVPEMIREYNSYN